MYVLPALNADLLCMLNQNVCLPSPRMSLQLQQRQEPLLFIAANGSFLHHFHIVLVWTTVVGCCIASTFFYQRISIEFNGTGFFYGCLAFLFYYLLFLFSTLCYMLAAVLHLEAACACPFHHRHAASTPNELIDDFTNVFGEDTAATWQNINSQPQSLGNLSRALMPNFAGPPQAYQVWSTLWTSAQQVPQCANNTCRSNVTLGMAALWQVRCPEEWPQHVSICIGFSCPFFVLICVYRPQRTHRNLHTMHAGCWMAQRIHLALVYQLLL